MIHSPVGLGQDAIHPLIAQILTSVSYSILAVQVLDWLHHVVFEFSNIWIKTFCLQKWQYLFSQYVGIATQIANIMAMGRLFAQEGPLTSTPHCQAWYFFVVVIAQLLLLSLELTIIHRIYALFDQSKTLLVVLLMMAAFEAAIVLYVPLYNVSKTELFGAACLMNNRVMSLKCMTVPLVQVTNQVVLFSLIISKRGVKGIPILSLVVRDSSWMFVALFALLAVICLQMALTNRHYISPHLIHGLFPIYVGVISMTTCHLIRNVEGIAKKGTSASFDQESAVILTSFVSDSSESGR